MVINERRTCQLCLTLHRGDGLYCGSRCESRAVPRVKVPVGVVRTPFTKHERKPRVVATRTEPTHVVITRCSTCCWCGGERPTQNSAWCSASCQNAHYKWRRKSQAQEDNEKGV